MKEDRIKKLESISIQIISSYFISELKELETEFWIININWIKISKDLSYMDIMVSSFKNEAILSKKLAKYAYILKKHLNENLILRKIPIIRFRYDKSWFKSQRINNTINNLS